jgi:uncharacterized membrane protein
MFSNIILTLFIFLGAWQATIVAFGANRHIDKSQANV